MGIDENQKKPIVIVHKKNGETKIIIQGIVKKEVSFLIDEKLYAELEEMCLSHEKKKDDVVNAAINLYIAKQKKENEIPKDQEEVSFVIDKKLYADFKQASLSHGLKEDEAVSSAMRLYIKPPKISETLYMSNITSVRKKAQIKFNNFYGKANCRIPKWARAPYQYNYKIIRAFFMVEDIVGERNVTLGQMKALCSDKSRSDVYVPTFMSNYRQMTFDNSSSHGKVFEDDGEYVIIWNEVEETLLKYKSMFYPSKISKTLYMPNITSVRKKTQIKFNNFYGKANRKIIEWAREPHCCSHKIIRAFFMAEDIVGKGNVTLDHMEAICSDVGYPDLYVPIFMSDYSRLTFDDSSSHGKVFENDDEYVVIWDEVKETLLKYKSMFYEKGEY